MQKDMYSGGQGEPIASLIMDENGWRVAVAEGPRSSKRNHPGAPHDHERFAEEDHGFQEYGYEDHELSDDDL